MKRKAHSRSFQRWKVAHPERLDRYRELQDALSPPKKGYGLRRALLRSGILVIATYVSCCVYTCWCGKVPLHTRAILKVPCKSCLQAPVVSCTRISLSVRQLWLQVKMVADEPQAADEALKADVRDLLKQLRLATAQVAQDQPADTLDMTEEVALAASPANGDRKWPLEYFLQQKMLLEDTDRSIQSSGDRRSTSVADNDSQGSHEKHAVCIISNDRGFDKLLNECKRAGCRTVAISDVSKSTYKHADVLLSWSMAESGMY